MTASQRLGDLPSVAELAQPDSGAGPRLVCHHTAQLVIPDGGARGTIIAQGGSYGGWGLMMHEGAARFAYNLLGVNVFLTDAERPVPAGEHQVRAEFAYDGGGLAKGGTIHPLLRR